MISHLEEYPHATARSAVNEFIDHLSVWSGRSSHSSFEDDLTLLFLERVSQHKLQPNLDRDYRKPDKNE